ncbi:uncharacterized protein LOC126252760 [Schistocerca nitens]|uniref:uncharacterized protein LOC126252760 n=1 Tax=Schistocerca nitens TaxID=7011 RepID=UPI002119A42D|nr:uncharacterized protein LOC126252760 [Schistocerca nitens]
MAVTLQFLATGECFVSLGYGFRMSPSYVSIIVRETVEAMCQHLAPIFLPPPSRESFREGAKEFYTLWGFPNCSASIDGKHIRIRCPVKSGSLFWNYKGYFSIVLLALVDANCKFITIDVGSYGKEGDSGIFNKSAMGKMIMKGDVFPADEKLPLTDIKMPFVIVSDEAFRL